MVGCARRRLSAEDLRCGLGAVGSQMDSEAVKKLANELDISGCGSVNLEVSPCLVLNSIYIALIPSSLTIVLALLVFLLENYVCPLTPLL